MAYIPIPPAWIEAGQPTKEELFTRLSDNQESFNGDIEGLKATRNIDIFNLRVGGDLESRSEAELTLQLPVFRAPSAGSIVELRLSLLNPSSSGTLSLMLDKSTDNGANFSPILSSPVTLTGLTAGSISGAVNFVSIPAQSFEQNDMIRIRLTTVQVDQGTFQISCYGEVQ